MLRWMAALASGALADMLAVLTFHLTNKNRAYAAASVNVLATACVLFIFVDVSRTVSLAVPYLIGLWFGGVIGVRLKKYLEGKRPMKRYAMKYTGRLDGER